MTRKYDYLVIGSGIAGMSFALKVAGHGSVALVCKTTLDEANTADRKSVVEGKSVG